MVTVAAGGAVAVKQICVMNKLVLCCPAFLLYFNVRAVRRRRMVMRKYEKK
ncbi:predicted protein [Sclerotinia sclerotiorum 1980 UF-70]|uniref:Uncharacterized protein n=1 Tax=Sclerotinia sclerotiorum (strain ATCC 18683 / 1980 / Ss-1) TaxID=665079 RepID=A7ETK6_SCLS1|nr:predicted protein [Sclerotinia sclerotiorum 1980 UF-70]EDN92798.1 predicted protein [Sclerotinia sclerotiorum 1980 UF-70]